MLTYCMLTYCNANVLSLMASVQYKRISQATVRDEIWFMTRVDVVATDGTVAIYFQQFYTTYG